MVVKKIKKTPASRRRATASRGGKKQENKSFISKSEKETFDLGKKIAADLKGGEVLCLVGDLGSGKTVFTKGLAMELGIKKTVTSPTFVLLKPYNIKKTRKQEIKTLVHIDAYRLQNGKQLKAIGAEDFFNNENCVTVIEWADRVKDIWPKKNRLFTFKIRDNFRKIDY